MGQTFFITASGTGIGKTLVSASLAYQLRQAGISVSALKPVISGYQYDDANNDVALLLESQRLAVNIPNVEAIAPWRFAEPLSPSVAAQREGSEIDMAELVAFCTLARVSDITLIEGAGGVMAPLTDTHTMRDWIAALHSPAILVVGTYLGALSHGLSAAEALHARGIPIQAVVVSESEHPAMSVEETARPLRSLVPYARYVVPLPRVAGGEKLWQYTADLTWMLT